MDEEKFGLTIKLVAERTGVSVHTLRAWERRYSVPSPARGTENKYRLYDDQDVADVLFIKQQVAQGIPPAQASALLRQHKQPSLAIAPTSAHPPIAAMQVSLMDAFMRSDETAARQIIDQAFALFAPESVALQLIEPTMREMGDQWLRNEMTVWQEHLASNIVQQKLFAILQSQPSLSSSSPHVIAACAPAEEHQLGLTIFALFARRQGWRVSYLGEATPLADLVDVARNLKASVIAISATTVLGLSNLIPWLDATNRPPTALVFGGRMPNLLPSLRDHLPGTWLGEDTLTAVRHLAAVKLYDKCWVPSKRVWNVTQLLQRQRLKIAGDVSVQFISGMPTKIQRTWNLADINFATLFLVDTLTCALAFDIPDLMDLQGQWLSEAMRPRFVIPQLIGQHLQIFQNVLNQTFAKEERQLFEPLLAHMKHSTLNH